jgi:transcription antitermination protein NusB
MSLRRKSRELALQMLFQWDVGREEPAKIEHTFWKTARAAESTRRFANELFEGAVARADESDRLAKEFSQNWRLERMAAVDRSILRLAIYELRAGTAPAKVVLDEAVELANLFSSAESGAFLNGVLDAVMKSLEVST